MNALNLEKECPRSPRQKIGGFIIAARALDKCRAQIAGTNGEYHFNCPLDSMLFSHIGITREEFEKQVSTGASDEQMGEWLKEKSAHISHRDRVVWNNKILDMGMSDLDPEIQEYLEEYIAENLPKGSILYKWFDMYDIEEGRM